MWWWWGHSFFAAAVDWHTRQSPLLQPAAPGSAVSVKYTVCSAVAMTSQSNSKGGIDVWMRNETRTLSLQ